MDLECLPSGAMDDQVEQDKLTPSKPDGNLTSPSRQPTDRYQPLIYKEQEEIPRLDSDDHMSDDEGETRRNRRSLPLRYASHSSRDSSPSSDIHPTAHDRMPAPPAPIVRMSSVLAKRHRGDFNDDLADHADADDALELKRRKEDLMQSQRSNRQVFDRNKRMFGMLMGTLKKFKTEETSREEVTLKRSKIDEKFEINSEVDNNNREPSPLLLRRADEDSERSDAIDKAEAKLDIMGRSKNWESSHRHLVNFIQTETKPKIFWLPKEHNEETEKRLKSTKNYYNLFMAERAAKCKKELEDLDKAPPKSQIKAIQRQSRSRSPSNRRRLHSRGHRSPASDTSGSSSSFRR